MEKKTKDGRKMKREVLMELRKRAVDRVQSGKGAEAVVRAMGFVFTTALAMYRPGSGWDALEARKRGGRPRNLMGRMIFEGSKQNNDQAERGYRRNRRSERVAERIPGLHRINVSCLPVFTE